MGKIDMNNPMNIQILRIGGSGTLLLVSKMIKKQGLEKTLEDIKRAVCDHPAFDQPVTEFDALAWGACVESSIDISKNNGTKD